MHYLVIAGALVNIFGTGLYIRDTFRGRAKPNRVTWFLWSAIPMIAFAAELQSGIGWSALPVFMAGFTPFMVLVASFWSKEGYWKLGAFDYLCGLLSIVAIVLWLYTDNPTIAIALSILADGLGTAPTITKTVLHPETESGATYLGGFISASTGVVALSAYTFNGLAFLAYTLAVNGTMLTLIYRNNKKGAPTVSR